MMLGISVWLVLVTTDRGEQPAGTHKQIASAEKGVEISIEHNQPHVLEKYLVRSAEVPITVIVESVNDDRLPDLLANTHFVAGHIGDRFVVLDRTK